MSSYQKCPAEVKELAESILTEFPSYAPVVEAKVKIDFLFAFAEESEDGESKGYALTKHGVRALGITRKLGLKDRTMGRGDAEVALDGDWWEDATEAQRRALLDHEMHHIEVRTDNEGVVLRDDLKRPKLKLRKHDVEVGWFGIVAGRHGSASIEVTQAKAVMDSYGQLFWPALSMDNPKQLIDPRLDVPANTAGKHKRKRVARITE